MAAWNKAPKGVGALFAAGGEVAANTGEALGTLEGSEAAGDLLFHFDSADVLFGLAVSDHAFGQKFRGDFLGPAVAAPGMFSGSLIRLF